MNRLLPFTKMNTKWITDLSVKHQTIKLLEDNIAGKLDDLRLGNDFLDTTQEA